MLSSSCFFSFRRRFDGRRLTGLTFGRTVPWEPEAGSDSAGANRERHEISMEE